MFSYEIVAGPVHLGSGDFQQTITAPPGVLEQLADQKMLDELLPEQGVVRVLFLPVGRTRGTRHLPSDFHELTRSAPHPLDEHLGCERTGQPLLIVSTFRTFSFTNHSQI